MLLKNQGIKCWRREMFRRCWQLLLSSLSSKPAQKLALTDPRAPDEASVIISIIISTIISIIILSSSALSSASSSCHHQHCHRHWHHDSRHPIIADRGWHWFLFRLLKKLLRLWRRTGIFFQFKLPTWQIICMFHPYYARICVALQTTWRQARECSGAYGQNTCPALVTFWLKKVFLFSVRLNWPVCSMPNTSGSCLPQRLSFLS